MRWPQWVILVLITTSFVWNAATNVRDLKKSTSRVTLESFIAMTLYLTIAWTLHEGGFW